MGCQSGCLKWVLEGVRQWGAGHVGLMGHEDGKAVGWTCGNRVKRVGMTAVVKRWSWVAAGAVLVAVVHLPFGCHKRWRGHARPPLPGCVCVKV